MGNRALTLFAVLLAVTAHVAVGQQVCDDATNEALRVKVEQCVQDAIGRHHTMSPNAVNKAEKQVGTAFTFRALLKSAVRG